MSEVHAVRVRSQRSAVAAVERARLSLVMPGRSAAPRAPFAVLVFMILGAGVVGLLMFNTQMQQASIYATKLQAQADQLEARSQALNLELERKRDPQQVAEAARRLGMVMPRNPAFVNLQDGTIDGVALPATAADATKVRPAPPALPRKLNPAPIERFVTGTVAAATARPAVPDGAASPRNGSPTGRNVSQNQPAQGDTR